MKRHDKKPGAIASSLGIFTCLSAMVIVFLLKPAWLDFTFVGCFVVVAVAIEWGARPHYRRTCECIYCGYDLRGTKGMCPECGKLIPPGAPHGRIAPRLNGVVSRRM
jgi:hypothetical protein